MSGDWYPGRLTQAKATFQDKDGPIGLQLGRAGQTYGRLPQATSRTDCQQSAQAQPALPSITKAFNRLVSSWSEISTSTADCPEQSTLPRASKRPGAVGTPHPPGKVEMQVRSHQWAIPRDRGGREAKSHPRSGRDALSTSPPIPRTGR